MYIHVQLHVNSIMLYDIPCLHSVLVVQLQRNSHAVKSCIISCGQSNTDIRCPILISDRKRLSLLGLAAFHSVASKIYTKFKMHQSSLQPEKMILVHLLDGVPPLNAKPTLTLTPPSVTEFSPGLHCHCTVPSVDKPCTAPEN